MNTATSTFDPDLDAIATAMTAQGLDVSVEYPGMIVIAYAPGLSVATGLHSFDYGSVSRLNEADNMWEPAEDVTAEVPEIGEYESDPETVAQAWSSWVTRVTADDWADNDPRNGWATRAQQADHHDDSRSDR